MKRNIILFLILLVLLFVALKFFILPDMKAEAPDENKEQIEEPIKKPTGVTEQPVIDGVQPDDEVIFSDGDEIVKMDENPVFNFDKEQYFMDGKREKAEIKESDYSYLIQEDAKEFEPKIPPEWIKEKTQIDEIEGYFEIGTEERMEKMTFKDDFSEEEMTEWEKINEMNIVMNEAFYNGDYNTYAKHMYKGWREFHGVAKVGMIHTKTIFEEMLVFYPEKMDLEIGYAYGFYFRGVAAISPEGPGVLEVWDGMMVYKQNNEGEWEVYYEMPFNIEL